MGPLSAISTAVVFFLYGLTLGGWATISAKVLAVVFLIAAALILLDVFVLRSVVWLKRGQ